MKVENSILNGDLTYLESVNNLLDAVIMKTSRRPQPAIAMHELDELLKVHESDSSAVTEEIQETSASIEQSQHQACNYLTMRILDASEGKNEILAAHNLSSVQDVLNLDENRCNQIVQEAQDYYICAGRKAEIDEMIDMLNPLMAEDSVF